MCTKKFRWFRTCTDTEELILWDEIKVINGVTAVQKEKRLGGLLKRICIGKGRKMHITGNGSALQLNENVMCPHVFYIIVNKYDNK